MATAISGQCCFGAALARGLRPDILPYPQHTLFSVGLDGGCVTINRQNFDAFVDAIVKAKPAGAKGKYVRKIALSSSMGPGVKVDTADVTGA